MIVKCHWPCSGAHAACCTPAKLLAARDKSTDSRMHDSCNNKVVTKIAYAAGQLALMGTEGWVHDSCSNGGNDCVCKPA